MFYREFELYFKYPGKFRLRAENIPDFSYSAPRGMLNQAVQLFPGEWTEFLVCHKVMILSFCGEIPLVFEIACTVPVQEIFVQVDSLFQQPAVLYGMQRHQLELKRTTKLVFSNPEVVFWGEFPPNVTEFEFTMR